MSYYSYSSQSCKFVYFKIKFCIYLRSYICWQSGFCKSESIIQDWGDWRTHLKRLQRGSPQCWTVLVGKLLRKFGLFLSSRWFLNILSKILLLLPGAETGVVWWAGLGLGGVGELETSLSCPLSSPVPPVVPPSTYNTRVSLSPTLPLSYLWRDLCPAHLDHLDVPHLLLPDLVVTVRDEVSSDLWQGQGQPGVGLGRGGEGADLYVKVLP